MGGRWDGMPWMQPRDSEQVRAAESGASELMVALNDWAREQNARYLRILQAVPALAELTHCWVLVPVPDRMCRQVECSVGSLAHQDARCPVCYAEPGHRLTAHRAATPADAVLVAAGWWLSSHGADLRAVSAAVEQLRLAMPREKRRLSSVRVPALNASAPVPAAEAQRRRDDWKRRYDAAVAELQRA